MATVNLNMQDLGPQLEKFERFETQFHQPAWLSPLRKAGIARFAEQGFPTLQQEDWRFTNVAAIAKLPFRPLLESSSEGATAESVAQFTFGRLDATRLVFLNGHFCAGLSSAPIERKDLIVNSLAAAMAADASLLQKHLGRYATQETNSFAALNIAFFQDGAFIHIGANVQVEKPIHLLFISTAKDSGATVQPRTLILAGKNSRATVLESYVSAADAPYFTNAVTELVLEEGATLEHLKHQDEAISAFHMAAVHARLERNARLISHSIALGARLSRNNIRAMLAGEGVECILNGLYLTHGEQLADHHMVVEHAKPNGASHEYFNGILADHSRGVFHGRILVKPDAQKTDAKQTNKNLLLSDHATIDTKPQLEIYADDVKCTHGATVGQLNEESIFYLRTRGIGTETARRMLIQAFAGEIIARVRCQPAREELDALVWKRLENAPLSGQ